MQDFDFTIKHRPGVTHQNADTLSRFPLPTTEDGTSARMDEDEEEHTTGQASALLCRIGQTTTVMTLSAHAPAFIASRRIIAAITSLQGEYPTSNISDTSPTRDDLLGDCHNRSTAPRDSPPDNFHKQTRQAQTKLRHLANSWVESAENPLPNPTNNPQSHKSTMGTLDTSTLGDELHEDFRAGVIMVDLFGGMAAGLEAHLRAGTKIFKYIYVDIDDKARKMAKHRLNELNELHPDQLPRMAFSQAFTTLDQDVNKINRENLQQAGAANPLRRWVIVAGWPC